MVRAAVVFQRVLDELKTGQAHTVEREVIGAARVRRRKRERAHVGERSEPGAENWPNCFVPLQIDATDFARAVIEIEIGRELGMIGLQFVPRRALSGLRGCRRRWLRATRPLISGFSRSVIAAATAAATTSAGWRRYRAAKVVSHIGPRAEQALLLASPEGDANRPPRRDADRLQNPHGFERDAAADGVVGRPGARMPRIKVATEHH